MKLNPDQFDEIMRKFPDARFTKTSADKVVFYRMYKPTPSGDLNPIDHYVGMTSDVESISVYQDFEIPEDAELYVNINGNDYLLDNKFGKASSRAYTKGFDDGYARCREEIRSGVWR